MANLNILPAEIWLNILAQLEPDDFETVASLAQTSALLQRHNLRAELDLKRGDDHNALLFFAVYSGSSSLLAELLDTGVSPNQKIFWCGSSDLLEAILRPPADDGPRCLGPDDFRAAQNAAPAPEFAWPQGDDADRFCSMQPSDGPAVALMETPDAYQGCVASMTPLHLAVVMGRRRAIDLLLRHGADPDTPAYTGDGMTLPSNPLPSLLGAHFSLQGTRVPKVLYGRRPLWTYDTPRPSTAIDLALSWGHYDVALDLAAHGVRAESSGRIGPAHLAIMLGNSARLCRVLHECGLSTTTTPSTTKGSTTKGSTTTPGPRYYDVLPASPLGRFATGPAIELSPLWTAYLCGRWACVDLLLAAGADVDEELPCAGGFECDVEEVGAAVGWCAQADDVEAAVRARHTDGWLATEAVGGTGFTLLLHACWLGDFVAAGRLLRRGADPAAFMAHVPVDVERAFRAVAGLEADLYRADLRHLDAGVRPLDLVCLRLNHFSDPVFTNHISGGRDREDAPRALERFRANHDASRLAFATALLSALASGGTEPTHGYLTECLLRSAEHDLPALLPLLVQHGALAHGPVVTARRPCEDAVETSVPLHALVLAHCGLASYNLPRWGAAVLARTVDALLALGADMTGGDPHHGRAARRGPLLACILAAAAFARHLPDEARLGTVLDVLLARGPMEGGRGREAGGAAGLASVRGCGGARGGREGADRVCTRPARAVARGGRRAGRAGQACACTGRGADCERHRGRGGDRST